MSCRSPAHPSFHASPDRVRIRTISATISLRREVDLQRLLAYADNENRMVKVTEIKRTCFACPAQWEAKAESAYLYIKFRWGHLDVRRGPTIEDAVAGPTIFEWQDADDSNGLMDYDELKRITEGVLDLPDTEIGED